MNDSEERSLAPSSRKLGQARQRGQIPVQRDTRTLSVTIATLLFVWLAFDRFAHYFQTVLDLGFQAMLSEAPSYDNLIGYALAEGAAIIGLLFATLILTLVVVSLILNRGAVFSFAPMTPNLSNMNPIRGAKLIFGVRALTEVAKSFVRLVAALAAVTLTIRLTAGSLVHAPFCGSSCLLDYAMTLGLLVFGAIIGIGVLIAAVDIPLQVWLFNRTQMMSRTEMKNEQKNTLGSPEIRRAQRRLRNEIMNSKGRTGLAHATLVVFGEGTAVGLRYAPSENRAPVVVARARGPATAPFLERAKLTGVPFYRENDLAQRLYRNSAPGQVIRKSEFAETAMAITVTKPG